MSVSELIQVMLMAFVLLAPTLMVAVLVSGLSRRQDAVGGPATAYDRERFEALEPVEVGAAR